jgi:hypothetical protein
LFEWFDAFLGAHCEKCPQRLGAFGLQRTDAIGVEVSSAVQIDELASERASLWVIPDNGPVPIDDHDVVHGLIPLISNQFRILATAALSVSGDGWGQWNTRTLPKSTTAIREPARSCTLPPNAINSLSMRAHRMVPDTERAKIASSTSICLSFGMDIVTLREPDGYHNLVPQ